MSRQPPQANDAERLVLGALLNQPEVLDEVNDILQPIHFFSGRHRSLFTAIQTLASRGITIDIVSVSEAVRLSSGPDSNNTDLAYIGALAMDALGMGNALLHARSVRQAAR
jgi:replicative DNA helicase